MILTVDIGNTNITFGIFKEGKLIETFRLESNRSYSVFDFEQKLAPFLSGKSFENCIIGSVAEELSLSIKQACDKLTSCNSVLFTPDIETTLGIDVESPLTVGVDRLANSYAALKYNLPAIVVDVGTAITLDIVSEKKCFIGGVIMSGLNMEFKSLALNTSKLPEIEPKDSLYAIGNNTEKCILSGVIRGKACAVEGLLNQCEKELGKKAYIIFTGGQCEIIAKYMTRKPDYINKNLTLEGLYGILQYLTQGTPQTVAAV